MLTEEQREAALLVAQGRLTIPEIAEKAGVSPRTVNTWKADPHFQEEVHVQSKAIADGVSKRGIGSKLRRQRNLNGMFRRSVSFMTARAKATEQSLRAEAARLEAEAVEILEEDPEDPHRKRAAAERRDKAAGLLATIPMVRTGMARVELKTLHVGEKSYEVVHEFFYDHQLLSEMRAQMEQMAIETGEWKNKISVENPDGSPLMQSQAVQLAAILTPEELEKLRVRLATKPPDGTSTPGNDQPPDGGSGNPPPTEE